MFFCPRCRLFFWSSSLLPAIVRNRIVASKPIALFHYHRRVRLFRCGCGLSDGRVLLPFPRCCPTRCTLFLLITTTLLISSVLFVADCGGTGGHGGFPVFGVIIMCVAIMEWNVLIRSSSPSMEDGSGSAGIPIGQSTTLTLLRSSLSLLDRRCGVGDIDKR